MSFLKACLFGEMNANDAIALICFGGAVQEHCSKFAAKICAN